MKRWITALAVCLWITSLGGCAGREAVHTDGYEFLIGVSLTNVMEPWLNNLVKTISAKSKQNGNVNLIFRDAAGSTAKQIQDIEVLMDCGIDLLILSPDGSDALNDILEETYEQIPVVVVGVEPETEAYTTVIQADDEEIGRIAGEYILEQCYKDREKVVVIQGVDGSPISSKRRKGFQDAVQGKIPEGQITYYYGDWFRDTAEERMKDFLVISGGADVVFAFNDEMAYGAYIAYEKLRVEQPVSIVGVDGFEGESAGLNLVESGILEATIQSPDFGGLAYDTAIEILNGKETQRNMTIVPRLITAAQKAGE